MPLSRCYSYLGLLLILQLKHLFAFSCHQCHGMAFNYSITPDRLPLPCNHSCKIVTAKTSCSVRVSWLEHNASEVHYTTDLDLPPDSVVVQMDRQVVIWSAVYRTRRFLIYTCQPTNTTPCNTPENLKRVIDSTTFPADEHIQKFDGLIAPTTKFFSYSCARSATMKNCPLTNLAACEQCWGIMHYSDQVDTCAICPAGRASTNFLKYSSTFLLTNQTRSDRIQLACRRFGDCNSVENLMQIKNTLTTRFDFGHLFASTASTTQLSILSFVFLVLHLNQQLILI